MTRAGAWLLTGMDVVAVLLSWAPAADLHPQLDLHAISAPLVDLGRRFVSESLRSTLPTNPAELRKHQADLFESRVPCDGVSTATHVGPPGFEHRGPPGEDVGLGSSCTTPVTAPATSVKGKSADFPGKCSSSADRFRNSELFNKL